MDLKAFQAALEQLEAERGINREKIIETIELALAAAYKKDYGKRGQIIKAKFDIGSGKIDFFQVKIAVSKDDIREEIIPEETKKDSKKERDEHERDEEGIDEEDRKIRFNPERHILIEEAQKINGCLGARMTGAGFGGCAIAIVHKDSVEELKNKVSEKYFLETAFNCEIYESTLGDGVRKI